MQGSYFHKLIAPQLILFVFALTVYWYQSHIATTPIPLNPSIFALFGVSLAVFCGFCNSAAYDRFWEGRKLWGSLVWHTRNIARQVLISDVDMHQKQAFIRLVITFMHALRHQLRDENNDKTLKRLLSDSQYKDFKNRPFTALLLTQKMGQMIADWQKQNKINSLQWQSMDTTIGEIAHIQAGCERIYNTPIPFAYFVLLHRTVYLYCFMLPFGLGNLIGWLTPFVVAFIGYTFMALNEIVHEIGQPFKLSDNNLPLVMMCDTIEVQLSSLSNQSFMADDKPDYGKNVVM